MSTLASILFPRRCLLCEQLLIPVEDGPICGECDITRYLITGNSRRVCGCRICGRPVQEPGGICLSCLTHGSTVPGKAFFLYEGAIRDAIHRFKYEDMKTYGTDFAELMQKYAEPEFLRDGAALVPIPIHKRRFRERGYNQAKELAEALSKRTGIPTLELLERVKNTAPQNQLAAQSRRENVSGAFALNQETALPPGVIYIVDDLYTSGSTVEEAARVLRQAYPDREVRFVTIAMRNKTLQYTTKR